MKFLTGLNVSSRLALSFGFFLILMVAITMWSVQRVDQINADLFQIHEVNQVKQNNAIDLRASVQGRAIAIRDVILVADAAQQKAHIDLISKLTASYAENERRLSKTTNSASQPQQQDADILARIAKVQASANPLVAKVISLASSDQGDAAKTLFTDEARPLFDAWLKAINEFIDFQEASNQAIVGEVHAAASGFQSTAIYMLIAAAVLALTAAFFAARSILRPMKALQLSMANIAEGISTDDNSLIERRDEFGRLARAVALVRESLEHKAQSSADVEVKRIAAEKARLEVEAQERETLASATSDAVMALAAALKKLAEGDLSSRITHPFISSLDQLRLDYNQAVDKLSSALSEVSNNTQTISQSAGEIRNSSDDLAQRSEQQAALVEETAAALEQITVTVKESTRRAQEAGALVNRTKDGAEQSGQVVHRAVAAMEQIERSSGEINNIISVIDDIAFQTNLLALNAGVEAARAGDAGKGFAVVAQEVRELAQRSANAAKEIKTLITNSNTQVQQGVQLVGETGATLEKIVSEVKEVNHHVSAIVEAEQEQSSGLQQINTAVNQMDQDTQRNASMVSRTNSTSHSLEKEVSKLSTLLSQFQFPSAVGQIRQPAPVREATRVDRPKASPVNHLTKKLQSAFGNAPSDRDNWESF